MVRESVTESHLQVILSVALKGGVNMYLYI